MPTTDDTAVFDTLTAATAHFRFQTAHETDRLIIRSADVMFLMNQSSYTLLNTSAFTPGLVVADAHGQNAHLIVREGNLETSHVHLGAVVGSIGRLDVDEPDAQLFPIIETVVGVEGVGIMGVTTGGLLDGGALTLGAAAGSFGALTVGSAQLQATTLTVGGAGQADILAAFGATMTTGSVVIAQQPGSSAVVDVIEPLTTWTITGSLDLGFKGDASMLIDEQAVVSTTSFVTIGTLPSAGPNEDFAGIGDLVVRGSASTLDTGGDLHVGFGGAGRWTLSSDGRVIVGGDLHRGQWLAGDPQPQTLLELSHVADYMDPAMEVTGDTDGFHVVVELVDQYPPALGHDFEVASAGAILDPFTFNLPLLPVELAWQIFQDATTVTLRVGKLGDLDGDDEVGTEDFLALLAAWGPCPAPPEACPADLDNDGSVGTSDFLLLLGLWG